MESAGVDAGENTLVGLDAARACPNASLTIPAQRQAGAFRNNILDSGLRPTTLPNFFLAKRLTLSARDTDFILSRQSKTTSYGHSDTVAAARWSITC